MKLALTAASADGFYTWVLGVEDRTRQVNQRLTSIEELFLSWSGDLMASSTYFSHPCAPYSMLNPLRHRFGARAMSFATTQPEALTAVAATLAVGVRQRIHTERLPPSPRSDVISAAAKQVSSLTTTQFAVHAQTSKAITAQVDAVHQSFASTLRASSAAYRATEVADAIATD